MKYNSKTTAIPEIIPVVLICTAGIILSRPDASLSCSFLPQGLFPPAGCISILLFCYTEIISTGRMHLYLSLLLHRDAFAPVRCISILLFCSTGIISAGRIDLYLALLLHRDYFHRPDASLSCSFLPQGLFCPGRMHLYLPLLLHRDYFAPVGCISILLFCYTEIISTVRMHLYLPLLSHRDYFRRPNASLSCSFVTQGLFLPPGFISILLFCSTEIISAARIHLYLALLLHRDYFHRPDASLSCFSVTQRLFPPSGCISILLFCYTEIISTVRMHLYLPLLFHRDYFGQPNASLIRAPVKYQRPNFYYTGNTRMASADTLCKKLPQDRQKQSVLSLSILYFCRYGDILFW